jgi:tRNA(fMet)-specific endonuclease VapC
MRGNKNVIKRLGSSTPSDCTISTITTFELLTGVQKCRDPQAEEVKIKLLMGSVSVLGFDAAAALQAAIIRGKLEVQGRTIGPYDLLLAGQAVASNLILVTSNLNEFNRVDRVKIEDWTTDKT